jgi:hypothetical protein
MGLGQGVHRAIGASRRTDKRGELALLPEDVPPPVFDDRILGATRGRCWSDPPLRRRPSPDGYGRTAHRLGSIRSAKWPSRSRHRTACGGSQLPGTSAILVGLRTWPLGPDGRAGAPLTTPIPRRNTQREDAEDRMSCLSLGYLRGDPGHHMVVVVGDVVLGDVVRSGVPDAVVAQDISQCLVEILCRVRAPDVVRMQ